MTNPPYTATFATFGNTFLGFGWNARSISRKGAKLAKNSTAAQTYELSEIGKLQSDHPWCPLRLCARWIAKFPVAQSGIATDKKMCRSKS
jgi:hypothetical protein